MSPKGSSAAWDHFIDKGQFMAECTVCKVMISFRSTVSNLTKHLIRKHPLVKLVKRNTLAKPTTERLTADQEPALLKPKSASESAAVKTPLSASPTPSISTDSGSSGTNCRVQPWSQDIASDIYEKNTDKCESEIDNLIMDLFVIDFQPFHIVEDKGFRNLMHAAFPSYVIPTRIYFENNLLSKRYGSLRVLKMNEVQNAESICITTDVWTSRAKESFLGITGHYIKDHVLKSVLLECVLLKGSNTSINLAKKLLRVAEEWKMADKILLAVSDNGANMKKAIEKYLGWNHFGCYAHTLNLAVQESLSRSEELTVLINRVKVIVGYFKKSALAWEKLKKCQEQAGKCAKRPMQGVTTRWNSTLDMIRRCLEIKEELNSVLCNLNETSMSLSDIDWELCENICTILKPFEEVTREITTQKYVSGSIVMPMTTGLVKSLENLDLSSYLPAARNLRQDLLSAVKTKFDNLDRSDILTKATFLDPRFKLYFEDTAVAESTKQQIVKFVIAQINREDREARLWQTEDNQEIDALATGTEPQQSTSSLWSHYKEKMKHIQPRRTATARANLEVLRYMQEVTPDVNTSPLDWWKERRAVYPHLHDLAMIKLNAVATKVPCERFFSACSTLLNKRRTRLGSRNVKQLMFLHQNTKTE